MYCELYYLPSQDDLVTKLETSDGRLFINKSVPMDQIALSVLSDERLVMDDPKEFDNAITSLVKTCNLTEVIMLTAYDISEIILKDGTLVAGFVDNDLEYEDYAIFGVDEEENEIYCPLDDAKEIYEKGKIYTAEQYRKYMDSI